MAIKRVGAAAVKITAEARNFHNDVRRATEKEKHKVDVPINLKDADFYSDMAAAERRIEDLDNSRIDIWVDVHGMDEANDSLRDLRKDSAEGVKFNVGTDEQSMIATKRDIDGLKDSVGDIRLKTIADLKPATRNMEDFFARFNNRTIRINSTMDMGRDPVLTKTVDPSAGKRAQSEPTQRRDPDRPFDTEHGKRGTRDARLRPQFGDTDSINAIPKYIDMMNLQLARGMKQLGDVYFQVPEKAILAMIRPIRQLHSSMASARTLSAGFASQMQMSRNAINSFKGGLDKAFSSLRSAGRNTKEVFQQTAGVIHTEYPRAFSFMERKFQAMSSRILNTFSGKGIADDFNYALNNLRVPPHLHKQLSQLPLSVQRAALVTTTAFAALFRNVERDAKKVVKGFNDVRDGILRVGRGAKSVASDIALGWDVFRTWGTVVGGNIVNGVNNAEAKIKGALVSVKDSLVDAFIHGPADLMRDAMAPLTRRFTRASNLMKWKVQDLGKTIHATASGVWDSTSSFRNAVRGFADGADQIPTSIGKLRHVVSNATSALGPQLRHAFNQMSAETDRGFFRFYTSFSKGLRTISDTGRALSSVKVLETFSANVVEVFPRLRNAVGRAGVGIFDSLDRFPARLRVLGSNFLDLAEDAEAGFRRYAGAITGLFQKIQGGVSSGGAKIGGPLSGMVNAVKTKAGELGKALDGIFKRGLGKVNSFTSDLTSALKRGIGNAGRAISDDIKGFGDRIVKGFDGLQSHVGKIQNVLRPMSNAITDALGNSPMFKSLIDGIASRITARFAGMSKMLSGMFFRLGGTIIKAMLPALAAVLAGLLALGGQVVIAAIMALGGAIGAVTGGAMLMLPAIAGALGGVFMALKIGLDGVKDGVSAAFSAESVEDFESAIEDLHPKVQEIARGLRSFKPAIDDMKDAVQDNLLDGLSDSISSAMSNLLPTFSEGLQNIATEWNTILANGFDQLSTPEAQSGLKDIMEGTTAMSNAMSPLLANLIHAFGDLAQQGSKYLAPIGEWIAYGSENFKDWAASLRDVNENGMSKFDQFMVNARENGKMLGKIFGGLAGTIANVFRAGAEGGGGMLSGMASGLQDLKEYTSEGQEGYAKMVEFMKSATDAASQLGDVIKPAFGILMNVGRIIADVATGSIPGLVTALEGLQEGFDPLLGAAEGFGEHIGNALGAFGPALSQLGGVLEPILMGLAEGIEAVFVPLGGALDGIMPALTSFAETARPVLETVGEAFGNIFEAAGPVIEKLIQGLEPFLPVLATYSTLFGDIISAVLDGLGPALDAAAPAMQTVAEALGDLLEAVGPSLVSVIESLMPILPPVIEAFGMIVQIVAPLIPIVGQLIAGFLEFAMIIVDLITPFLPIILGTVMALAAPIAAVVGGFYLMAGVAKVLGTVSKAIQGVTLVWKLLSLAFAMSPIGLVITLIAGLVAGLIYFFTQTETGKEIWRKFTDFLGEKWEWFRDLMIAGWNWIKENVFDKVPAVLQVFQDGFQRAVDIVKNIWDGLKRVFANPIGFFIDVVWNKGLVDTWNGIVDKVPFLGEKLKLNHAKRPEGIAAFAQGGVLPGYSPGRDIHEFSSPTGGKILLSGGEAIMRPEWTRAVGGPAAVEQMNRNARSGRLRSNPKDDITKHGREAAAFANGGVIGAMMDVVRKKYPMLQMTSGLRAGDGGMHGSGNATDWSNGSDNTPEQLALARDIAKTYPNSAELIYDSPGWSNNIKNGANVGPFGQFYTMAQAGNHRHHVHWGMTTPPTMAFGGGVFAGGSDGSGGGDSGGIFRGIIDDMLSSAWEKLTSRFTNDDSLKATGVFGEIPKSIASEVWDRSKEWLVSKIPFSAGGGGGSSSWDPGAGVEQYRSGIEKAFKFQDETATKGRVDALLRQISTESGGDPNIAQQIVDVNGTGESAGVGLYQVIPTTWAGYRDPRLENNRRNVWAAHNFAVRYFRDRHNWNTGPGGVGRGHGWKTGGVLPEDISFFDQGGLARGKGVLPKDVVQPERVLSPRQTLTFDAFVYDLLPQMIKAFRNQPKTFREMTEEIVKAITFGNVSLEKMREEYTENLSKALENAIKNSRDEGDRDVLDPFGNKLGPVGTAGMMYGAAVLTPNAYLDAEDAAYEQVEKEQEEAASQAESSPSSDEPTEVAVVEDETAAEPEPMLDENGEFMYDEDGNQMFHEPEPEDELGFDPENVQDVRIVEDITGETETEYDPVSDSSSEIDTEVTGDDSVDVETMEDPVVQGEDPTVQDEEPVEVAVVEDDTEATEDDSDSDGESSGEFSYDSEYTDGDEGTEPASEETPEADTDLDADSDSDLETADYSTEDYDSDSDVDTMNVTAGTVNISEGGVAEEVEPEPMLDENGEQMLDEDGNPMFHEPEVVEVENDALDGDDPAADAQIAAADSLESAAASDEEATANRAAREGELLDKEEELSEGEKRYGFEVLNRDGSNPNEYEQSEQEVLFRNTLNTLAGPVGFGGLFSKISDQTSNVQSLASGIMTAMPAWTSAVSGVGTAVATGNFAAIPGAISGLAHNVAAASAQAAAQTAEEFMDLIPATIGGVAEMFLSSTALNSQQAPFIGQVNSGMTQGELMQTMDYAELKRARKGGGTPRMRG